MTGPVVEVWQFEILDEGYLLHGPDGRRYGYGDRKALMDKLKAILGIDEGTVAQSLEAEKKKELLPEGVKHPEIMIPRFDFDKQLATSDGLFSYAELPDGRIALRYISWCVYTNREKLAALPSPLPLGHLRKLGLSPNASTAIKRYLKLKEAEGGAPYPKALDELSDLHAKPTPHVYVDAQRFDLQIPKFEYDPILLKTDGNFSYAELPDGRIALKYRNSRYYTTKEKLAALPTPLPRGHLRFKGLSADIQVAIRAYLKEKKREKGIETEAPPIKESTPHREDTGKPPQPIEAQQPAPKTVEPFREIDRFIYPWSPKTNVGDTSYFKMRDKMAIKMMGSKETVFTTEEKIEELKKLTRDELVEATRELNSEKRRILVNFIHNLKNQTQQT